MKYSSVVHTLSFIIKHPLNSHRKYHALLDYFKWQIGSRLVPGEVLYDWIEGVKLIIRPGETGLTQNVYCGLQEFYEMGYVLHVLNEDDLFVDIGANSGAYTLLACGVCGADGYAIEPIPKAFIRLQANIRLNNIDQQVKALNIGISSQEGELLFTDSEDTMNHVISDSESTKSVIKVNVGTLDKILEGESPSLIKIDVEGFEMSVLNGASRVLNNKRLHSLIIELNGSGARYSFKDEDVIGLMGSYGFYTYHYNPFERKLRRIEGKNIYSDNALFIRNEEMVIRNIIKAPERAIKNNTMI